MFDRINDSLSHNSLQLNGENMKWWLRLSFCFHGRKTVIRVSNNMRDEYMMYVIAILILGERIFYFPFPSFFFYFLLNLCMKLTISSYVLSFIHSFILIYLFIVFGGLVLHIIWAFLFCDFSYLLKQRILYFLRSNTKVV